jgi:hypothetical protein
VTALDAAGKVVSVATGTPAGVLQTLNVSGNGIVRVIVKGQGEERLWVIKVCAREQQESPA